MESAFNNYSIRDLETLTGIKAHTIRIWEKRYGILAPERSDTNIRTYSEDELKKLLNISFLNRYGVKISHIAALKDDELNTRVLELSMEVEDQHKQAIEKAVLAAMKFKKEKVKSIITDHVASVGFEDAYIGFLNTLATRAKLLWQAGRISRSQADLLTSSIEEQVVLEDSRLSHSKGDGAVTFLIVNTDHTERFNRLWFYNYALRKRSFETLFTAYPVPMSEILEIHKIKSFDFLLVNLGVSTNPEEYINYLSQLGKLLRLKKIFINDADLRLNGYKADNIVAYRNPEEFIKFIGRV